MPLCPKCDDEMVEKRTRNGDRQFWSCIHYPNCSGSRPYLAIAGTTTPPPEPRAPVKHRDPVERLTAITGQPAEDFERLTAREQEMAGLDLLKDRAGGYKRLGKLLEQADKRPTREALALSHPFPGGDADVDDLIAAMKESKIL